MGCGVALVIGIIVGIIFGSSNSGLGFPAGLITAAIVYAIYSAINPKKDSGSRQTRPANPPRTPSPPDTPRETPTNWPTARQNRPDTTAVFNPVPTASPTSLKGLNDAFTGETLNTTLKLYQCSSCKVYYHESSVDFLRQENSGRCVSCLGTTIVTITDSRTVWPSRIYEPEVITLSDYEKSVGRVVTFIGTVQGIKTSRYGRAIALMFENKSWAKGFKLVVFPEYISAVGGEQFLHSLTGKTIKVRGLLVHHNVFGYEIILTGESMILEII